MSSTKQYKKNLPGSCGRVVVLFSGHFMNPKYERPMRILERAKPVVAKWLDKSVTEALISPIADSINGDTSSSSSMPLSFTNSRCECESYCLVDNNGLRHIPKQGRMDERLRQLQWTLREWDWIRLNNWQTKLNPSLTAANSILSTLHHYQQFYKDSEGDPLVQICLLAEANFLINHFKTQEEIELIVSEYPLIIAVDENSLAYVEKFINSESRKNILLFLLEGILQQPQMMVLPPFRSLEDINQQQFWIGKATPLNRMHSKSESALEESPSSTTDSSTTPPPETSAELCQLKTSNFWNQDNENSRLERTLSIEATKRGQKGRKKILRFEEEIPTPSAERRSHIGTELREKFLRNRHKFERILEHDDRNTGKVTNEGVKMRYAETERHGIEETYSADYAPARRVAPWLEEMLSKRLFDEQQNAQLPMPTIVHCCRCANGHAHCCCCIRQKSTANKMGEGTRATTFQNTHPNACSCCKESAAAQQRDMIVKQKQHKSQKPESILLVYRKYKLNQPESSV